MNHSVFGLSRAELINSAIAEMPVAYEQPLAYGMLPDSKVSITNFKAIVVNGQVVDCPTSRYVLKQHSEAFRPVIEGLTLTGTTDFQFNSWHDSHRAKLNIFVGNLTDGVKYGFQLQNSFDRTTCMSYSMKADRKETTLQIVQKEHVLVWGFRQVCSNGLVIKVPLKSCKYLDAVEVTEIKNLLANNVEIRHIGKEVDSKLSKVQHIVEAYMLLRVPLNKMIQDAMGFHISREQAEAFISKYESRRRLDHYMELFGKEEQTLWGLYNAMTYFASHKQKGITMKARETIMLRAANMMEQELLNEA